MGQATVEDVANAMYELVKSTHGKKNLKPMDLIKAMIDQFGEDAVDKKLCKTAIRSLTVWMGTKPEGTFAELRVAIPVDQRRGLVKLLEPMPLDARPPDFVPANLQMFQRIRLDLPTAWKGIEQTVRDAFPSAGKAIDLVFSTLTALGRAENPDFEMRSEWVGNLGQDVVLIQKPASEASLIELDSGPSLLLLGSPQPDRLVGALRLALLLLPLPYNELGIRSLGETTLYTIPTDDADSASLGFLGGKGYLVFSLDEALIEAFLGENPAEAERLNRLPGLEAAVQQVAVVFFLGFAFGSAGIRTGFRFGQPECDQFAFGSFGQVFLFLFLGSEHENRTGTE